MNDEGCKKLWKEVFRQAFEDVTRNGGLPVKGGESVNMKLTRQLEAYHWLFSERSDDAFESQGVWAESFREKLRRELRGMGFVLPQGPVTKISRAIPADENKRNYELDEAA
jgi:hypothetical protein